MDEQIKDTFFSVIIATYNRAYCLHVAIESVLDQTFHDWELLIIDDGSTDETAMLLRRYQETNAHIRAFSLGRNRGVNFARNRGVEAARGQWIVFLDSDNALLPECLEIMHREIARHGFHFYRFPCRDLDGHLTVARPTYAGFLPYKDYLRGAYKGEYHSVVRARLQQQFPFDENIVGGENIVWCLIAGALGGVMIGPQVTLLYNNKGKDRLSVRARNCSRLAQVFKKELSVLGASYLRYCPILLCEKGLKWLVYSVLSWREEIGRR